MSLFFAVQDKELLWRDTTYSVRHLSWADDRRQRTYQQLRARMLVDELGWSLPIDEQGRERDRYDREGLARNGAYCVYGWAEDTEYLLAGIRIFQLATWRDTMITQEFVDSGLIPSSVVAHLYDTYAVEQLIEMNRICLERGRRWVPPGSTVSFELFVARDLLYACAASIAEQTGRTRAIGIVHPGYLIAMQRGSFVIDILYASHLNDLSRGYALVVVDIAATIRKLDPTRQTLFLSLCDGQDWVWLQQASFPFSAV